MRSVVRFIAAARRIALDVEALVLPRVCLGCEQALPGGEDEALCGQCRLALRPMAPPRCPRCWQTLDRWETAGRKGGRAVPSDRLTALPPTCGFCRTWPDALAWAASAVWFDDGPARELVHALKYGGWTLAAAPMASAMAREIGALLKGSDLLVPVPLGAKRRRERGHNQAELLADALGVRCGKPVAASLLVRSRETRTQTSLHPEQRRANVRGAFRATRPLEGARALLVDDVLTTGATLAAAAQALKAAGAAEVGAVSFARAPKPE